MNHLYFEAPTAESARLHPSELLGACLEHGTGGLLLDDGALPPEFFDLSSRVAGELVQRVANYGLRMAVVVPDLRVHSGSFEDFAREATSSRSFRFFRTRPDAVEWLTAAE